MATLRQNQPVQFTAAVDFDQRPTGTGVEGQAPAATSSSDTGVTGSTSAETILSPKTITLTLAGVAIAVTEANGYGGTKILDLVDGNLVTFEATIVDLIYTKDGTGYITTSDLTTGIGTATASNATLSGAMVNVLGIQTMAADVLAPTLNLGAGLADPLVVTTSSTDLFLNVAGATEVGDDASVTVTGTIILTLFDHGAV